MTKRERFIVALVTACVWMLSIGINTEAMHIMEGYLPPVYCIGWGIVSVPFLVAVFFR